MKIVTKTRLLSGAATSFGVFLVLHGLAHAPGVIGSWQLKTFEGSSYQPNILLQHASDPLMRLLGALWLMAGLAFIAAGIGLIWHAAWVRREMVAAVLLSLVVSSLWWRDAIVGLVINVIILSALVIISRFHTRSGQASRVRFEERVR